MNELTIFQYTDKQVRTVVIAGEPWFVAKDVCEILELSNVSRSLDRLPEAQKGITTVNTPGGPQEMNIISEAGVYKLVFTSRKPEPETIDPDSPPRETKSRFSASANIEKPWSRTNDHSFSRKELEKICKAPPDPAYWERRYPGYTLIRNDYAFKAEYNDYRGWAAYLKLRKKD